MNKYKDMEDSFGFGGAKTYKSVEGYIKCYCKNRLHFKNSDNLKYLICDKCGTKHILSKRCRL